MTQSAIKANSFQNNLSAFQFSSNLAKADEETQQFLRVNALAARNVQPDVSGTDFRVIANEQKAIKRFVKVTDPDNDSIVRYRFRDLTSGKDSGFFSLGGMAFAQDKWFVVNASSFGSLVYVAGKVVASETIKVQAFDGSLWSNVASFTADTLANDNPPIVRPANFDIRVSTSAAVANLFIVRDEDRNTIKKYRFTDTNGAAKGGYLTRNGVKVAANTPITLDASKLDTIAYQAGNSAFTEFITVEAFDGKFWSNPTGILIETLDIPIIAPEIFQFVDEFKKTDFIDLFHKVDKGPFHTSYQIFDNNPTRGSGELVLGNTPLGPGIHTLTDVQLENLVFRGGNADTRWLDEIFIRANNRLYYGDWIKIDMRTEPVNKDALEIPGPFGPIDWFEFVQGDTITYSFMEFRPAYGTAEVTDLTFRRLSVSNKNFIRDAIVKLGTQIGVNFEEVSDSRINPETGQQGGLIRMGGMDDETKLYYSLSFLPGPDEENGDIYLNFSRRITVILPDGTSVLVPNPMARPASLAPDNFARYIFQRDLGTALGMKFPSIPPSRLPAFTDDRQFTVMTDPPPPFPFFPDVWPSSYQLYDLLALQDMYSPQRDANTGDNTYSWNPNRIFSEAIWDPAGNDTINASNQSFGVTVDLRTGGFSSIGRFADENVGISYGTIIENAKGSRFGDELIGNEYGNRLEGNDGRDTLDGGPSDDYLLGGAQNDTYIFRLAGGKDIINEQGKGGVDALEIRIEWSAFDSFPEDLTFKRLGKDLLVDLNIDDDPLNGSIRIKNMGTAASRVETLRLFNPAGNVIPGIGEVDLTSIWAGATSADQHFKLSGGASAFGLLASPV